MFGDEEEASVRAADPMYYDTLVGGADDSISYDRRASCCELICGRPRLDEPKCNLLVCNVSRRVLKNMLLFLSILLIYILFLSLIMGNRSKKGN